MVGAGLCSTAMKRVIVFGATSAIAAAVAQRLARRGDLLWLVGRDRDKLDRLVASLGSAVVGAVAADLDRTGDSEALVQRGIAALGGLDLAIVAHGMLGDQRRSEQSWSHAEEILRTNLLSPVSLLVPLANALEAQGHGDLAVLSSVAGIRGRPRNFTYGAAKAGLTAYTQGLRSRLWKRGVGVHTFKLGPVDTPMTVDHPKNALFARVDPVADAIVAAIDARAGEVFVPRWWAPIMGVVRRLPESVFQRVSALAER